MHRFEHHSINIYPDWLTWRLELIAWGCPWCHLPDSYLPRTGALPKSVSASKRHLSKQVVNLRLESIFHCTVDDNRLMSYEIGQERLIFSFFFPNWTDDSGSKSMQWFHSRRTPDNEVSKDIIYRVWLLGYLTVTSASRPYNNCHPGQQPLDHHNILLLLICYSSSSDSLFNSISADLQWTSVLIFD
jgi:hypothetical protein